ncbi:MAG TPA: type II secretion system protein GspN [Desulfuromonadales bacterium]|nr:type II secretion system protein GspN [Desulfuromonadales bacterium]
MKRLRLSRRSSAVPRSGRWSLRVYLGAGGILIAAFLVGLYLFFPTTALKERLETEVSARTPLTLDIGHLALALPLGVSGAPVTLVPPAPAPPFRFEQLRITPAWGALFSGHPGARIQASLLDGELSAVLQNNGAIEANANGLHWSGALGTTSLKLAVTLKNAHFTGAAPLRSATSTRLTATLADVQLHGVKALGGEKDSLNLGTIVLQASGRGNSFRIDHLDATGGSLGASVNGTLLLANPVDRSRINLIVTLRPAASFDKNLASLLNLVAKPERDGTYRLHLTGTVARPQKR